MLCKSPFRLFLAILLGFAQFSRPLCAQKAAAMQELWLPSEKPSEIAQNDRIWLRFFPAQAPAGVQTPAVLLLPYLGARNPARFDRFARSLSRRGMAAVVVTLPYHGKRLPRGDAPNQHFVGAKGEIVAQAFEQSASDVSSVVTWLSKNPLVDTRRIGAAGVSLGAIVVHLAMGRDARISAGVAALGGGDLVELRPSNPISKLLLRSGAATPTAQDEALIREVDPLSFANQNRPRRVLMIQAARDSVIAPRIAEKLWRALGRPPIQWVDTNHVGLLLGTGSLVKTTAAYFETAWSDHPDDLSRVPQVRVPTLKFGILSGLDSKTTPAAQIGVFSLGTRRHMALVSANVGLSGRGPFAGVAATITPSIDLGLARRLGGDKIRPYASFHVVF